MFVVFRLFLTLFLLNLSHASSDDSLPNILFLIPDQWRSDFADDYFIADLPVKTPLFTSLVNKGVRFPRTITSSPLCSPSRASFATGREYSATGVPNNNYDLPENLTTFYQLLRDERGYLTMITGKDDLTKVSGCGTDGNYRAKQLGFSKWARCKGKHDLVIPYPNVSDPYSTLLSEMTQPNTTNTTVFEAYATWLFDEPTNDPSIVDACEDEDLYINGHYCPGLMNFSSQSLYEDDYIADQTLRLLQEMSDSESKRPWFLQVNMAGPHPPFGVTLSMNESVSDREPIPMPINASADLLTEEMVLSRQQYIAMIEHIDSLFERIYNAALDRSQNRSLLVCMFSDHGEMLGDWSQFNKLQPWFGSLNVPFVCAGLNGLQLGKGISYPHMTVSLVDITATVLDLAGFNLTDVRDRTGMTSASLLPWLKAENKDAIQYREYLQSGYGQWRTVIEQSTQLKLICCNVSCEGRENLPANEDGQVILLYNTTSDIYDLHDLSTEMPDDVDRISAHIRDGYCQ